MSARALNVLFSEAVKRQDVPGVIALAVNACGTLAEEAHGFRTLGKPELMTPDTVVWIASMTKAVTSAAVMQQVEQGRLSLDGPVSAVIAELADVPVLEGFSPAGDPLLRAAKRPITLRHLLTQTVGFTYEFSNADMRRYMTLKQIPGIMSCTNATLRTPLIADPGTTWEYGTGIDWAGKMVEAVTGQKLSAYLQKNMFEPLGMTSTSFLLSDQQRSRLAGMHARLPDGSLTVIPFEMPQQPEFEMGGGGLYSTLPDYLRFAQMIAQSGSLDGQRVLKEETVQSMTQNHVGDLDAGKVHSVDPTLSNNADFFPGMRQQWGLSFLINPEPGPDGRSAGSLAWAGLANAYYWIDPKTGVCAAMATQILPFFDDTVIALLRAFERGVYQLAG